MKWLNVVIKYRLWIGIVLLALAIFTNVQAGFWPSFVLYLIAVVLIVGHFVFGPMRLIQDCMETGDMEGAKKVLDSIWFPALLIKPIRSVYYTDQNNYCNTLFPKLSGKFITLYESPQADPPRPQHLNLLEA
jgi:general stress protein CsbA